jgi:hypothetical protein
MVKQLGFLLILAALPVLPEHFGCFPHWYSPEGKSSQLHCKLMMILTRTMSGDNNNNIIEGRGFSIHGYQLKCAVLRECPTSLFTCNNRRVSPCQYFFRPPENSNCLPPFRLECGPAKVKHECRLAVCSDVINRISAQPWIQFMRPQARPGLD